MTGADVADHGPLPMVEVVRTLQVVGVSLGRPLTVMGEVVPLAVLLPQSAAWWTRVPVPRGPGLYGLSAI